MKYNLNERHTEWLNETYEKLEKKMAAECARVGTKIPFCPRGGKYVDLMMPGGVSWWTNGFWPGMLWQMNNATKADAYKQAAQGVEQRLAAALEEFDGLHHDVGFLFILSAVANYRVTGNKDSLRRAMHAANLLAGRFNVKGGFIRAWNDGAGFNQADVTGWMIVDCLMNINILYWASEVSGDPRYAEIANRHADTATKYLMRPDGSCNHIASFNPATGEFIEAVPGQGYGEGSAWSRGQGWALYGFSAAYRHTGNEQYLNTAKRCAHFCIASLAASDWLPLVDFRAPEQPVKYDTGGGTIIASGLLELAEHVPELERHIYVDAAVKLLQAIDKEFANWNPDEDAIIGGGTTSYHSDKLADLPTIYNDYYFLEAVLRLKDKYLPVW